MKLKVVACCLIALFARAEETVTLRGGGLEVSANLTGWTQSGGPEVLHESYVRLGTFDTPKAHLALLVDSLPKGADLSSLCERTARGHKGGKIVEPIAFAGKAGCLISASPSDPLSDLFFEMLMGDHWLEWHYSALRDDQFVESGRRALEPLIASVSAKVETVPTAVPQSDLTDRQLEFIQKAQKCGADSKDFICRALAAFKTGRRPSGRPNPVGIIGVTFPLGTDESVVAYLVLSDTAVRQDTVILKGKKEESAGTELLDSLKAGKQPPKNNMLAAMARSQHDATPALMAERSMLVPLDEPGKTYLRETSDGLVSISIVSEGGSVGIVLGIYPTK